MIELVDPFRRKYHKTVEAVSRVSFELVRGDVLGIIGQNGSGKSTLLRLIAGIVQPTSGTVSVPGRISALLELGIGFNPDFSGRQNVYLYGAILGMSRQEIDDCFSDIVAFSGIGDFIDQPVRTYSSGMYIRLAFSLAINVKPDILVVDEALAVGDALFQAKCYAKFQELHQKGTTIIAVTHSTDLVTRLCNKACLLDRGKLVTFGKPKHVVDMYNKIILWQAEGGKPLEPSPPPCGVINDTTFTQGSALFNPVSSRYGNGKATIEHIGIYTRDGKPVEKVIASDEYEIRVRIVFSEQVANPVISYRIKVENGVDISGTNTLYHNVDTKVFAPGDKALASFFQRLALKAGEYFLSASCAGFENGGYVVYDRWCDAVPLRVTSPNTCDGHIHLDTKISISREGRVSLQSTL